MRTRYDISRRGFIGGVASAAAIPLLSAKSIAVPKLELAAFGLQESTSGLPRSLHAAVALANGHILVCGGYHVRGAENDPAANPSASVQLFDPDGGRWFDLAPMRIPRARHSALLLSDGSVVVAGGYFRFPLDSVEIYDPEADRWHDGAPLPQPIFDHTATLVDNEMIMIGGRAGTLVSRARIEALKAR